MRTIFPTFWKIGTQPHKKCNANYFPLNFQEVTSGVKSSLIQRITRAPKLAITGHLSSLLTPIANKQLPRDFFRFLSSFSSFFRFLLSLLNHTNELDPRLSASIFNFNWHHAAKGTSNQHFKLRRNAVPAVLTFRKRWKSRWWTSDAARPIGTFTTQFSFCSRLKEMKCKKIYGRSPMIRLNVRIDSLFCVIGMSIKFVSFHCPPCQPCHM